MAFPWWVVVLVVVVVVVVGAETTVLEEEDDKTLQKEFDEWMVEYGISYGGNETEKASRMQVYKANKEYVRQHNSNDSTLYTLELNAFADRRPAEPASGRVGLLDPQRVKERARSQDSAIALCNTSSLATHFDWRSHGVVTPIKDQAYCGSCWAFASVATMESAYAISKKKLMSLSEQEIVSCTTKDNGCDGGYMDDAFAWVIKNGGIDSESDYPYVSGQGDSPSCNSTKASTSKVANFTRFVDVPRDNETALLCSVAQQPVTVAIDANMDFQLYASGIFDGGQSCPDEFEDLDHAVVFVGWGSHNNTDYWIVKNSWSTSWGMEGYAYIKRNSNGKRGVCGVNYMPSYPIV